MCAPLFSYIRVVFVFKVVLLCVALLGVAVDSPYAKTHYPSYVFYVEASSRGEWKAKDLASRITKILKSAPSNKVKYSIKYVWNDMDGDRCYPEVRSLSCESGNVRCENVKDIDLDKIVALVRSACSKGGAAEGLYTYKEFLRSIVAEGEKNPDTKIYAYYSFFCPTLNKDLLKSELKLDKMEYQEIANRIWASKNVKVEKIELGNPGVTEFDIYPYVLPKVSKRRKVAKRKPSEKRPDEPVSAQILFPSKKATVENSLDDEPKAIVMEQKKVSPKAEVQAKTELKSGHETPFQLPDAKTKIKSKPSVGLKIGQETIPASSAVKTKVVPMPNTGLNVEHETLSASPIVDPPNTGLEIEHATLSASSVAKAQVKQKSNAGAKIGHSNIPPAPVVETKVDKPKGKKVVNECVKRGGVVLTLSDENFTMSEPEACYFSDGRLLLRAANKVAVDYSYRIRYSRYPLKNAEINQYVEFMYKKGVDHFFLSQIPHDKKIPPQGSNVVFTIDGRW